MNELSKKLLKFLCFGLLTYGCNIGVTFVCVYLFLLKVSISYGIALIITTALSFFVSINSIFKVHFTLHILYKYLVILILINICNYFVVLHINDFFHKEYLVFTIIFVTTVFALIKFILYDRYVFIKK